MQIGQRVIVDAAVTEDGIEHHGEIFDIFEYYLQLFVEVALDDPDKRVVTVTDMRQIKAEENENAV
jgi:hypothetical protein